MTSIIDLTVDDDSYIEHRAAVKTRWGATYLRTVTEKDFITALLSVLPIDSTVCIIRGELNPQFIVKALHTKGYKVFISNRSQHK